MALNPVTFLKESKTELEKVIWPTRLTTLRLTIVVIITTILVGAFIAGLDAIFSSIVSRFLTKGF